MPFVHWPLLAILSLIPVVSGAEGPSEATPDSEAAAEEGFESRAERRRRERAEAAAAEEAAIEALEKKAQAEALAAPPQEEASGGCD